VAAVFSAEEIIELTEGRLAEGFMPDEAGEISTDTRRLKEGEWFLALRGKTYDGHDFIGDAYSRGALGCIVEDRGSYPIAATEFPLIAVGDTLKTLAVLARNWRRRMNPRVIALTGCRGEPSLAVAALAHMLDLPVVDDAPWAIKRPAMRIAQPVRSERALSALLLLDPDIRLVLLELTGDDLEDIYELAMAAQPNIAVITECGLDDFRLNFSEEEIIDTKVKIIGAVNGAPRTAVVVTSSEHTSPDMETYFRRRLETFRYNTNEVFDSDSVTIMHSTADALTMKIKGSDQLFSHGKGGTETLKDTWCVIKAARALGMPDDVIAKHLKSL